jgi:hypothetical protein
MNRAMQVQVGCGAVVATNRVRRADAATVQAMRASVAATIMLVRDGDLHGCVNAELNVSGLTGRNVVSSYST